METRNKEKNNSTNTNKNNKNNNNSNNTNKNNNNISKNTKINPKINPPKKEIQCRGYEVDIRNEESKLPHDEIPQSCLLWTRYSHYFRAYVRNEEEEKPKEMHFNPLPLSQLASMKR